MSRSNGKSKGTATDSPTITTISVAGFKSIFNR